MPDQFQKFTERARRVLALAEDEARRFNHHFIGTEHLLLGLLREGDGVAGRVLSNLGIQLPKVRTAVEFIIGRGEPRVIEEIGLTDRAKKVIELAVDEARRLNHHYIGTEHLLLGLIREGEGIAAGVLESQGARLENVRAEVMQVVRSSPGYATLGQATVTNVHQAQSTPALRQLVRVLPIAQVQRHGNVEAIALALEVYADGFVVTLLLQATGEAEFRQGSPDLPLTATDDRGGRYTSRMHGGSGGGHPQHWQWRLTRSFTPALDPAARELRLEAAEFHWLRPDPAQRTLTPASAVPGPWTFTVALPSEAGG